jgi:hypothetical protein
LPHAVTPNRHESTYPTRQGWWACTELALSQSTEAAMTSETTRQALCCECGAMTHATWQTGPRRPCTGRESARADTPPWSASNSCLVRRTPAPSVHYTHSRVVLSTSPKPPRSPAPSGSPLAPLLLGARLDPAHPVAELHRAGGVGVVSKCWPSTGCATGRGRFWCKSCDDHSPD